MKLAIFSSGRADMGLLEPLAQALMARNGVEIRFLISGSHLAEAFGNTRNFIDSALVEHCSFFPALLASDDAKSAGRMLSLLVSPIADHLVDVRYDKLLVLGDRFELLAVASAALVAGLPIVHLHGGELTLGAVDDRVRHAVTKLSDLHLVSTDEYRQRVIQMGEPESTVFNVGAIGLKRLESLVALSRSQLIESLSLPIDAQYCLVSVHPETLDSRVNVSMLLSLLVEYTNLSILVLLPNFDEGYSAITADVQKAAEKWSRIVVHKALPRATFLSAIKHAEFMVGNSSAGILEAPSLLRKVINIGQRQLGRARSKYVLDASWSEESLRAAIMHPVEDTPERDLRLTNPYESEVTIEQIASIVISTPIERVKGFMDLKG